MYLRASRRLTLSIMPLAALVTLLLSLAAALAEQESMFQAMADQFSADLKAHNSSKIAAWYSERRMFFGANLLPGPDSVIQNNRNDVAKYWNQIEIDAINIKIRKTSSAPGFGAGAWVEESDAQIVTSSIPPRSITVDRAVIWRSDGGKLRIEEELLNDMARCTRHPEGYITCP